MLKKSLVAFFATACAGIACALTPIPHSVSQAKLDKFMADYGRLHKSGVLDSEFEKAMQEVSAKLFSEPGVAEDIAEASLNMPFLAMTKTAERVKQSGAANAELAQCKWGKDYWDVFAAVTFAFQYSQMADSISRAGASSTDGEDGEGEVPAMKPIAYYMDTRDYALIMQNKDKLGESMQTHSGVDAGGDPAKKDTILDA